MLEIVSNVIQTAVLGVCVIVAFYYAVNSRSRSWLLYGLFSASFFLGDLWWVLFLLFYDSDYGYSLIPYINWKASILFLILLMQYQLKTPVFKKNNSPALCVIPLFCAGMCLYYMKFGAYLDNSLTAILMCILIWIVVQRLLEIRDIEGGKADDKALCILVFFFCISEYIIWTATCLDYGNPLRRLYDIFGALMTAGFVLIIPAMKKAVKADELH